MSYKNNYTWEQAKAFGRLVRERRQERGLTGKALANILGVSPAYVSMLENVQTNPKTKSPTRPRYEVLSKLKNALDLGERAYNLLGLDTNFNPSYSERDAESTWNELFDNRSRALRGTFGQVPESKKGEILEQLLELLKKYKPQTSQT